MCGSIIEPYKWAQTALKIGDLVMAVKKKQNGEVWENIFYIFTIAENTDLKHLDEFYTVEKI